MGPPPVALPESICFVSHFIAFVLIIVRTKQKADHPLMMQNSPKLIVLSQVMLLLASLSLLIARVEVKYRQSCSDYIDDLNLVICNLLYTFSMELIMFTYLLMLLRVELIYYKSTVLIKVFREQWLLCFIAFVWALLIVAMDLLIKFIYWDLKHEKNWLKLYPQIDQFFYDQTGKISDDWVSNVYTIKLIVYLILYLILYILSYRVNPKLSFRFQYNSLLTMKLSLIICRNVVHLIDGICSVQIVHYLDCLTNLIAGFVFTGLYYYNSQIYYLTTDEQIEDRQFTTLISCLPEARYSLQKYFESRQLGSFFEFFSILRRLEDSDIKKPEFDQIIQYTSRIRKLSISNSDIKTEELASLLKDCESMEKLQGKKLQEKFAVLSKQQYFMKKYCEQIFEDWKKTKAYRHLIEIGKENRKYENRMKELGIFVKK